MTLKKITGKDFKEAVDWLWGHKAEGGCVHQVLGTTNDGTKLCFVVGWSEGADYGDDDKKYGYFYEGYCISAKIGYQHRNNAMQTDYDWDFNMPYDLETGDVWDTSSYVPRDADWEREAADYNKEAEKIWAAYGDPDGKNFWDDDKAPLDLMESKKSSEAKKHTCSMQKKKESLAKKPKKCEGLMDDLPYDAPVAIESLCAEIMSHTEAFTIEDADVAEMCGKWYIRDYANGSTAANNEDEFVDEVLAGLSGSPVDGSPFSAAEAEGYARKIYNEVVD